MTVPIKYRISSVAAKPVADSVKGVPLTSLEIDGNFRSIKDAIEDFSETTGASLVGYDDGTVQDVLDSAKPLANYAVLRAYTGRATSVRITEPGIAGFFRRNGSAVDNGGTVIKDGLNRSWERVFDGPIMASWWGVKAGVSETANLIQQAIDYCALNGGGHVLLPDDVLNVGQVITAKFAVKLTGGSTRGTILNATTSAFCLKYESSSIIKDLYLNGNNIAQIGIQEAGTLNRAVIERIRIENFTISGFSCGQVGQVNNSKFSTIFSQFNPVNFAIQNALNCTFFDCNGNLRNASEGGLASDRNIKIIAAAGASSNGLCRNTTFFKGIFERSDIADYCIDVESNINLSFYATEFNTGVIAKINLAGGSVNLYDPHFTLGSNNICAKLTTGAGQLFMFGSPQITGRSTRSDATLFDCPTEQDGVAGVGVVKAYFKSGNVGGLTAFGAATFSSDGVFGVRITNNTTGVSNRVSLLASGQLTENSFAVITVYVSKITTGTAGMYLSQSASPFRQFISNLVLGENRFVVLVPANSGGSIEFLSGVLFDISVKMVNVQCI